MSDFKITDKSGIKLKTANKYVTEDLAVTLTDDDINNTVSENIKKGITILGVMGTYEGESGGDTTQEDGLVTREITSYTNDRVSSIGNYAFYYNTILTSVSFPNVTIINDSAFQSCSHLTSVSFPNATVINNGAFQSCTHLTSVSFPNVTSIGNYAFVSCIRLTSVSFPNVTSINSYAFNNCKSLIRLVITQTNKVCTLSRTTAFNNCYHFLGTTDSEYNPDGLKDGRIYVPDKLVDSYKSATNWSAYADIIVPLSTLVE